MSGQRRLVRLARFLRRPIAFEQEREELALCQDQIGHCRAAEIPQTFKLLFGPQDALPNFLRPLTVESAIQFVHDSRNDGDVAANQRFSVKHFSQQSQSRRGMTMPLSWTLHNRGVQLSRITRINNPSCAFGRPPDE